MNTDDPYFRLQAARRALRAASHKHARTKNTVENKPNHDVAVDDLEKAALVFALFAAEHGLRAGIAAPALSVMSKEARRAYADAIDPELRKEDG
jgi:hypothetical protein